MKSILSIMGICFFSMLFASPIVYAANGAFQIYNGSISLPDGSVMTTAPKDGKSVLNGSGAPSMVANIGDFYIDTTNNRLYGPYAGTWGVGVSLVGPQGLKGDTGANGQVTLASMCSAITTGGAQLPSFCPGYSVTYSLADLKGTWKTNMISSSTDGDGVSHALWWERSTSTISVSGVGTVLAYLNSDGSTTPSVTGVTYAISPDGTVTIPALPSFLAFNGTMSMDKNLFVFTMNTDGGVDRAIGVSVKVAP